MAPSQAQQLLVKAEKKANASTGWFSSSSTKYEEAGDLYQEVRVMTLSFNSSLIFIIFQAANAFKLEKLFKESGEAFTKEAECRQQGGERDEAANAYWNAAKSFKRGYPDRELHRHLKLNT